jgi:type II secretory pathway pseudopilin PulG
MIVVAILAVLVLIALPKFAAIIRKSKEAATLGQLGAIRSALTIYYSENEGIYPNIEIGRASCRERVS